MRAVQVLQPTGPADVRVVDVEEPTPGPDDVLVEVHSVGISFPDLLLSKGQYQMRPEPPFTLGVDVAGTVVSTGPSGLEPGSRVCGVVPYGAAGERAVIPAGSVFPLPDRLSYDEGAALPMNYLTALFALQERGQLRAGETVLVHGAAGGRRYGDPAGRQGARRPHHRRRVDRGEGGVRPRRRRRRDGARRRVQGRGARS